MITNHFAASMLTMYECEDDEHEFEAVLMDVNDMPMGRGIIRAAPELNPARGVRLFQGTVPVAREGLTSYVELRTMRDDMDGPVARLSARALDNRMVAKGDQLNLTVSLSIKMLTPSRHASRGYGLGLRLGGFLRRCLRLT